MLGRLLDLSQDHLKAMDLAGIRLAQSGPLRYPSLALRPLLVLTRMARLRRLPVALHLLFLHPVVAAVVFRVGGDR